ncbi:antibiotic biosynthesis monooxygenase family protein [Ideonella livida]|uniref:Antibiotic biosynthesis monooxygenase n=1 Tax=Ideonella livida TaxID=2707176 RepID=A0A7C9TK13_9BURK|nr:antibiotic biosynthesis monooxygenase [Ideonella livida]NDY92401.1 antibiotic biosynthesis monooxygenase [Ideonella livida]
MYSATFLFIPGTFDDEFHRLDQAIAQVAKSLPGYLGEETWAQPGSGRVCNVYYWETLEALQALMQHPLHLQAKAAQGRWLDGYEVIISQVLRRYGDRSLSGLPTGLPSGLTPQAGADPSKNA